MKTKLSSLILGLSLLVLTSGCWLTGSDTYDTTKYTAAHEAALNGDDAKLASLLKAYPTIVNTPDYDKSSLLHLSVAHNRTNTEALLLDSGADVNAQNTAGMTPLHIAAREGFFVAAKMLVDHHADLKITDNRGWTALKWAEMAHKDDVAGLLRNALPAN